MLSSCTYCLVLLVMLLHAFDSANMPAALHTFDKGHMLQHMQLSYATEHQDGHHIARTCLLKQYL